MSAAFMRASVISEIASSALGTFTMILYVLALLTSTATYVLLYVIWPPLIG